MTQDEKHLTEHMLELLETPSHPLTPWEEDFLASVAAQFEEHGDLSEGQLDKLKQVYAERTT